MHEIRDGLLASELFIIARLGFGRQDIADRSEEATIVEPSDPLKGSKLHSSVWWLRLGIDIERIKPGCPQQNGRHERMHLTLKLETTKPAGANFLQQQRFDAFIAVFNNERPHQAIAMRSPAQIYRPSSRRYHGLPDLNYPFHDKAVTVTTCGRICFHRRKINLSQVFAGQTVGIKQVDDRIWLASFMHYDFGYFDDETCCLEPLHNPFGPKVLPMSPV